MVATINFPLIFVIELHGNRIFSWTHDHLLKDYISQLTSKGNRVTKIQGTGKWVKVMCTMWGRDVLVVVEILSWTMKLINKIDIPESYKIAIPAPGNLPDYPLSLFLSEI